MSHLHERKEKTCLNCGQQLEMRYCPRCGQENVEPKESVWHFVTHFFNDITHFDGKFFSSMKLLFARPGLLSKGYMAGRRARYLNPIRMYLFVSFVFFLVFFYFPSFNKNKKDPSAIKKGVHGIATTFESLDESYINDTATFEPRNEHEYDSLQLTLPVAERDQGFTRYFNRKGTKMFGNVENNQESVLKFRDTFLHSLPQALFISLPIFALFLYLLYLRRRRAYYYVSHAVFTIHIYCTTFILMMLLYIFSRLGVRYVDYILFFAILVYLYGAMLRFYGQGWLKTFFKFLLLNIASAIMLFILLAGIFVIAIITS